MEEVTLMETVAANTRPAYRGVHHLALNTDDMKATIDFYAGVLGMPLVHAMRVPEGAEARSAQWGNPPFPRVRHYFFDMGNDSLLAFFEMPKGATQKVDRNGVAGMQHVALAVSSEQFDRIQLRLEENSIPYQGPITIVDGIVGAYFTDPNGIRLEITCQPRDGAHPKVVKSVEQSKEEALEELALLHDEPAWLDRVKTYLA
jgi:catechol 2,3-dioxygenase-like lactoylglutathione lyase family enzyme